ncbi:MAG: hypothetical protein U0271_24590 [Polyangiaceae bacterium]
MRLARGLGAAIALFATLVAAPAIATPSRWELARGGRAYPDEVARREVEVLLHSEKADRRNFPPTDPILGRDARFRKARYILEDAKAESSPSWYLRLLYARILHELDKWKEATPVFEGVLADPRTPDVFKADLLADLAIAYARIDRQPDEIEAYEGALALTPIQASRCIMLSNQAEAFMVSGDISRAILGYRAALEGLTILEAPRIAPTTLWSLAVALDRGGDLGGALETVQRARSYDPNDVMIHSDTWFFVPAYDQFYYEALGTWDIARRSSDLETKRAFYEKTLTAWRNFLQSARASDPYVPVARARLALAEREAAELEKRARTPTPTE